MKPAAQAMGYTETVVFIAACMALNALSIDVMLPALPEVGRFYDLADSNSAQAVIAVYLLGMGISQLFYGPLSDRFGRRPVLVGGLVLFVMAGLIASVSDSFTTLLVARFLQGAGAGSPRVIATSLARDKYSGKQMGRVMSMAMMVFMVVPILAPALGQLILFVAPWRWTFGSLVVAGGLVLLWACLRLDESLPEERRRSLSITSLLSGYKVTLTTRITLGYMLAMALMMGIQMGFVTSAQQIFVDVFDTGNHFTLFFALVAMMMSLAAFINSRLLSYLEMRTLAVGALVAMVTLNIVHATLLFAGYESLVMFLVFQGASMFLFGILASNLNAMAMEPMGHAAGMASSVIGFVSTCTGALLGYLVGQMFDGSVLPLVVSYLALSTPALGIVLFTERKSNCMCSSSA